MHHHHAAQGRGVLPEQCYRLGHLHILALCRAEKLAYLHIELGKTQCTVQVLIILYSENSQTLGLLVFMFFDYSLCC